MKFKNGRLLYLIPLVLIVACFVTALVTRFSYTDNPLQYLDGEFSSDTQGFCVGRQPMEIQSLDDMFEASDLIVQGRMKPGRQITLHALFTKFQVSKVYKGDPSFTGKELVVVEPIVLTYSLDGSTPFQTHGGYMPLTEGTEYLLFLNAREWVPEKNLTDFEQMQYLPAYPGAYSSYKLSSDQQDSQQIRPEGITVSYLEVQELDIYSRTPDAITQYYSMREEIFGRLHIKT